MARLKALLLSLIAIITLAAAVPTAHAQVIVVRRGHRRYYHREYHRHPYRHPYYRHGHRYYR